MSFKVQHISPRSFERLDELYEWVKREEAYVVRIPVKSILKNGVIYEDQFIGNNYTKYEFTEPGLKALCNLVGFNYPTLQVLQKEGLSSDILNDVLQQAINKNRLKNMQFVINEKKE